MSAQQNKDKGFTIIEVVLVLAIAGLIFLMVFIALPALQRNQRDQQRRGDLSRAQTAVQNYQTNNKNAIPQGQAGWNSLINDNLQVGSDKFEDPSGKPYTFSLGTGEVPTADANSQSVPIQVATGKVCDGENLSAGNAGRSKVALRIKLEGGGVACVSN